MTVSSSRFTFTYPIRLVITLFIFYFYNTSGIFNSNFYRQQFLNNLKDIFVSHFYFIFASNCTLVFSHHHLETHIYSQRIAFGCQEQIVYRIWSMSYLAALNMLSCTLPLPNSTLGAYEHSFLGVLWELEANLSKRWLSKVEHSFF